MGPLADARRTRAVSELPVCHAQEESSHGVPYDAAPRPDRPRPRARRPLRPRNRCRHRFDGRLRRHQAHPQPGDRQIQLVRRHLVVLRRLLNRNVSTCTSFDQLNLPTAQGAQTLKSATGCALNITGGTETGHASGTYSHWNGYKLDFAKTTCLTNYVHGVFSYIGLRGDGAPQYKSGSGNIYADEGNHWDVTYYNCGGC